MFRSLAIIVLCMLPASAQKPYAPPHTPYGQPDFEGIWTNATLTPLERPAEFANKPTLTPQEAAEHKNRILQQFDRDRRDGGAQADLARAYGSMWWDADTKLAPNNRTSLIVDPPDGKVPPLTPAAQQKLQAARAEQRLHPADGPESRSLTDRCLVWPTAGPPMLPSFYNNAPYGPLVTNYEIAQTPAAVVILMEIIHDARIIPVDGRPHLPDTVRQWFGDPRGHWDGNTLVVETTNFTDKTRFRGSGENMRLTERFTRTAPDTILYEFTVNDPESFTRPWSAVIPMIKSDGPIYEHACHEGNYALAGILGGARADEKKAAEEAGKKK